MDSQRDFRWKPKHFQPGILYYRIDANKCQYKIHIHNEDEEHEDLAPLNLGIKSSISVMIVTFVARHYHDKVSKDHI